MVGDAKRRGKLYSLLGTYRAVLTRGRLNAIQRGKRAIFHHFSYPVRWLYIATSIRGQKLVIDFLNHFSLVLEGR